MTTVGGLAASGGRRALTRTAPSWVASECAVFFRIREEHGALSNMADGFPISVPIAGHPGLVSAHSTEALYQACRYPDRPAAQESVLAQRAAMAAKQVSRSHLLATRPDWDEVRVRIMWWVLCLKLHQHPARFGAALEATGDRAIVERSSRDPFWGAVPRGDLLVGDNRLGTLLARLRGMRREWGGTCPHPPSLPRVTDLRLLGQEVVTG